MKIQINIDTEGAAFTTAPLIELTRIFTKVTEKTAHAQLLFEAEGGSGYDFNTLDLNGNTVASVSITR